MLSVLFLLDHSLLNALLPNRLSDHAICTVHSDIVNPLVASRAYASTDPTTLHVDRGMLYQGHVLVKNELRGAVRAGGEQLLPSMVVLQESGRIPPNTVVAIVNPQTGDLCKPDQVGEICVCSPGNITQLEREGHDPSKLQFQVNGVDPKLFFSRTGSRGFLWPVPGEGVEMQSLLLGSHNSPMGWQELVMKGLPYDMALFVVSRLDEEITINHVSFPVQDLEQTIEASHPSMIPDAR
jgi:acyl-CoA synthetase (AMP-forming)/AMP-acid ligase II